MQIGYDFFVFKYPLNVNKNFQILINIVEINVNFWLLYAQRVMSSIILHTRRPNSQ